MIQIASINNLKDVEIFAKQLHAMNLVFHCDDPFTDYINFETREPTFTPDEAARLDGLMAKCFEVCEAAGVDIYDTMKEVVLIESGMSEFIPLPSQSLEND